MFYGIRMNAKKRVNLARSLVQTKRDLLLLNIGDVKGARVPRSWQKSGVAHKWTTPEHHNSLNVMKKT